MDKELEYLILHLKVKMNIILDINGADQIRAYYLDLKSSFFKKALVENFSEFKRLSGKFSKLTKLEAEEIHQFCKSLSNCTIEDIERELNYLTQEEKCIKSKLRTRAATRTNIIVVLIFLFVFVFIKGVVVHYVTEMNSNKIIDMQTIQSKNANR